MADHRRAVDDDEARARGLYRVQPAPALTKGVLEAEEPGVTLGWYVTLEKGRRGGEDDNRRWPIVSAGPVQVGLSMSVLGVAIGQRWVFLARDGRLWRVPKLALSPTPPPIRTLTRDGRLLWADQVARAFLDKVVAPQEWHVTEAGQRRYRAIVRALVQSRVMDAATHGFELDARAFARGVCVEWSEQDLVGPRAATVKHALLVSLVLALPADKAAELVELGGFLEYRVPFVSRDVALGLYTQAVALLSRLCPQWHVRGYETDWTRVGDIDRLLRAQYARMMYAARERSIAVEELAGLSVRELLADREVRLDAETELAGGKGRPGRAPPPPEDEEGDGE